MRETKRLALAILLLPLVVDGSAQTTLSKKSKHGRNVFEGFRDLLRQQNPFAADHIRQFLHVPIDESKCVIPGYETKPIVSVCAGEWVDKRTGARLNVNFRRLQTMDIYDGEIRFLPSRTACLRLEQAEMAFDTKFRIDPSVVQEPRTDHAPFPIYRYANYSELGIANYKVGLEIDKSCITSIVVIIENFHRIR